MKPLIGSILMGSGLLTVIASLLFIVWALVHQSALIGVDALAPLLLGVVTACAGAWVLGKS